MFLIVETTIMGAQVGLVDPSKSPEDIWWSASEPGRSSGDLTTLMAKGLSAHSLLPNDISGICVGRGPGSFTGIKIGLAFAYGLSRGGDKRVPVIGASPLELLGSVCEEFDYLVLPATRSSGYLVETSGDCVARGVELVDVSSMKGNWGLLKPWPALVEALGNDRAKELDISSVRKLVMKCMAEFALKEMENAATELPLPLYVRSSRAEERLQERTNG